MDFAKHAYVLATVEALRANGSWCGKTHLQKSLFLTQLLTGAQIPFQFILYKHGPYSFDVESAVEEMKSYAAITIISASDYGVNISPAQNAEFVKTHFPLNDQEQARIHQICSWVGTKNVGELEKLATATWVHFRENVTDPTLIASRIHQLKPHISVDAAQAAVDELTTFTSAMSSELSGVGSA